MASTGALPDNVPAMGKRQLMNLLLLGALSLPTAAMLGPYASFFVPPGYIFATSSVTIFLTYITPCNKIVSEQSVRPT
jgi:nucleoside permease NupC